MPQIEWVGFNTRGVISSKNGEPFQLPDRVDDYSAVLKVDDVIGYENNSERFVVASVTRSSVKMYELPE